jgi:hypothetical protein
MSPPTEQLIRDYLNRLSVAARDRLGPDDRRALVDRTRKLIERKADFAGRPTLLEVGKVLARLGDPAVLVEQEWRRLAAVRREASGGVPQQAGTSQLAEPADSLESAEPAEPGISRGFLARVLRREPGRVGRSSPGWPTAAATENGASDDGASNDGASDDGAAAPGTISPQPHWPSAAQDGGTAAYPEPDLPVRNGTIIGTAMTPADPGRAEAGDGTAAVANGAGGTHTTDGTAESGNETGDEFETPPRFARVGDAVRLLGRLASAAWQQPLEATAIVLIGVGGVIFPPVFVLGALVALGSRLWHYRDKWVGLVLPVVLTIIGVAAGIAVGGRSHGLHYGWVCLNIVSRIAAVLGAGYLAWRTGPGRRPPPAPPWHKPHRVA